jgi:UTP-glucose-1-phosphate uridylyltransferase
MARSEKASLRDVTYTVQDEAGQEYVLEEMLIDGIAGSVVVVESSVEVIEDEF